MGDNRYRLRDYRRPDSKTAYSNMINEREKIRSNTNKVNCFVDKN